MSMSGLFSMGLMGLASKYDYSSEGNQNKEVTHQDWRDTVVSFGKNKRFAILEKNKTRILIDKELHKFDESTQLTIYNINIINDYTEISPYVYALGENGYIKLNYETAEVQQNKDLNTFSKEDQEIFKKLEPSKGI